ncbi:hypothetical protein BH10PSE2_BH10PSE2_29530 [soil metagenome]
MIAASLAVVMLAASGQSVPAEAIGYSPATGAYSFTIAVPEDATLIHREILDFDLYQIIVDGRPVLGLYEGFTANVSSWVQDRHAEARQDRVFNGQPTEYFWNLQCDGWSNEVHAWLLPGETEADATRGRQVAETLALKPCVHPK